MAYLSISNLLVIDSCSRVVAFLGQKLKVVQQISCIKILVVGDFCIFTTIALLSHRILIL